MRLQKTAGRMVAVVTVVGALMTPALARAQDVPLARLLPELILRDITVQSPGPNSPSGNLSHVAHFSPIEANEPNNPAVGIVQGFNGQMATQFSTFPLGSSTGGLTYVIDESLGTFRRSSASFGPLFAERALTIGRRKLSAGFNYQRTSYDTFEGQHLDDGSIKFYLRHQDCCTIANPSPTTGTFFLQPNGTRLNPPFEGDLIEAALSLKATTNTTAFFLNYGVTDRWDIGLALPHVQVDLDVSVKARIVRLVTEAPPNAPITAEQRRAALNVHTFETDNPNATRTVRQLAHASGLGDLVLRTKYHVLRGAGGGLAAAVDLRLPTGDKDELLGAGGFQGKVLLVASTERGRFGQHVNVGYTAAEGRVAGGVIGTSSARLPDEINYTGGVEFVVSPRLSVVGDVVGRTLRQAGRLDLVSKSFTYPASNDNGFIFATPGCENSGFACTSVSLDEFAPRSADLTLLLGTAGAKFNPVGNLLVTGSVLYPLTKAGLRSRVTAMVGIDYAF
jgi:hypothetical protein